jgi:hypothetical protein
MRKRNPPEGTAMKYAPLYLFFGALLGGWCVRGVVDSFRSDPSQGVHRLEFYALDVTTVHYGNDEGWAVEVTGSGVPAEQLKTGMPLLHFRAETEFFGKDESFMREVALGMEEGKRYAAVVTVERVPRIVSYYPVDPEEARKWLLWKRGPFKEALRDLESDKSSWK